MQRKLNLGIAALVGILVLTTVLNLYFIRDDSGGYIVWNADEAYLFIKVARRGFYTRCIAYPWLVLSELLYAPASPDDGKLSMIVIRLTQSSVERHSFDLPYEPGIEPNFFTPLEGRIYANCPHLGGLCTWNKNHFEAATPDDKKRLDDINRLASGEIANVSGWSKRAIPPGFGGGQVVAEVGRNFSVLVNNQARTEREYPRFSIEVLRPPAAPEQILYIDETPRMVSGSAYRHAFWQF